MSRRSVVVGGRAPVRPSPLAPVDGGSRPDAPGTEATREPFPWLDEALREIEDIRSGVEVDGPPPTSEALRGAVELLFDPRAVRWQRPGCRRRPVGSRRRGVRRHRPQPRPVRHRKGRIGELQRVHRRPIRLGSFPRMAADDGRHRMARSGAGRCHRAGSTAGRVQGPRTRMSRRSASSAGIPRRAA